ncbi:MAG: 3-oxoacyl-ACP synthase [Defluviitaleaceae bacterium]|nr:3-oxoacyl-ACP synthase [Defluviitaleaceae bacterium]
MVNHVGIAGLGLYLPESFITAKEISERTNGVWSEQAVIDKLGIIRKTIPGKNDGAQEMGVYAARKALEDASITADEIDLVLCITEEWKEYPLTTSANYIIKGIGAVNAWGIDVQNRCCTCVAALKIAKDIMLSDDSVNTLLIAGGYRNCDLVDYADKETSMMFDLAAGGGAILLKKNFGKNLVLGSHIISDGVLARSAGVMVGGSEIPVSVANISDYNLLRVMEPDIMKDRLKAVSMSNWSICIDRAFEKSGIAKKIDYLAVLHFKRSAHEALLASHGLTPSQGIYLEDYGHIGQIDQILSMYLAREDGRLNDGDNIVLLAAGIGYTWAASVVKWGSLDPNVE